MGAGQKIAADVFETLGGIAGAAGSSILKSTADLAGGTVEALTNGPAGMNQAFSGNQDDPREQQRLQVEKQQRDAAKKRRFQQLLGELEEYKKKREQQKQQEMQVKKQEVEQKKQVEISQKKKKEQEFLTRMKSMFSGSHEATKMVG